ncbi:MAG: lycopene cyclase domain-containing protein [Fimbriimonadaceae bacterium]|nr:lycopene cyclase domain-containing protein [Alphaproteobacteria bacterium]
MAEYSRRAKIGEFQIIAEYPYLFVVLLGLPPVMAGFALAVSQRKMMLVSALSFTIFSPLSVLHQDVYWSPSRIGQYSWGIEDVLCCFSIGSLIWLAAVGSRRHVTTTRIQWPHFLQKIGIIGVIGVGLIIILNRFGAEIMVATIVVQIGLTLGILILRPDLWRIPVRVAAIYLPYYTLILTLGGFFSSTFYDMWNGPEILGPRILGLPIEEFLWACSLGSFPLAMAYASNTKITTTTTTIS